MHRQTHRAPVRAIGTNEILGTLVLDTTASEILVRATAPATELQLPEGEFEVITSLSCDPAGSASDAQSSTTSEELKLDAYRALNATVIWIRASVVVHERIQTGWRNHAKAELRVAFEPAPAPSPTRFGAATHLFVGEWAGLEDDEMNAVLAKASDLGAEFVRLGIPWSLTHPLHRGVDPGVGAKLDNFVEQAEQRGIKIIAILGGVPCWASVKATRNCTTRVGRLAAGGGVPSIDLLREATAEAVDRWRFWAVQTHNEPNLHGPVPAAEVIAYTRAIHDGVREDSSRPDTIILGCSLAGGSDSIGYLRQLYALGLKGLVDVISVHPYNFLSEDRLPFTPGSPRRPWAPEHCEFSLGQLVPMIRSVMEMSGDDIPIWLTEYGFTTNHRHRFIRHVTERERANNLAYALDQASRLRYVEAMCVFELRDPRDPDSSGFGFGLATADLDEKASFGPVKDAFARMRATQVSRS